jgi:hypothetical protein
MLQEDINIVSEHFLLYELIQSIKDLDNKIYKLDSSFNPLDVDYKLELMRTKEQLEETLFKRRPDWK